MEFIDKLKKTQKGPLNIYDQGNNFRLDGR